MNGMEWNESTENEWNGMEWVMNESTENEWNGMSDEWIEYYRSSTNKVIKIINELKYNESTKRYLDTHWNH